MNCCKKCNRAEPSELATCDLCNTVSCQNCSKLTSTEIKAVNLKKRLMIYWCLDCKPNVETDKKSFSDENSSTHNIHKILKVELSELLSNCLDHDSSTINQKLNALSTKIDNLKDSNIDLVKMLTDKQDNLIPLQCKTLNNDKLTMATKDDYTSTSNSSNLKSPVTKNRLTVQINSPQLHKNLIVGNKKIENSAIKAAIIQKQTSIYVGNMSVDVSEKNLEDYLKNIFGEDEKFVIKRLKVHSGEYNAFRVDARFELLDQLLDPNIWIDKITVKKFEFFQSTGHFASQTEADSSIMPRKEYIYRPRRDNSFRLNRDYSPQTNRNYSLQPNRNYFPQGDNYSSSRRQTHNFTSHQQRNRDNNYQEHRNNYQPYQRRNSSERREYYNLQSRPRENRKFADRSSNFSYQHQYAASPVRREYYNSQSQARENRNAQRSSNFSTGNISPRPEYNRNYTR